MSSAAEARAKTDAIIGERNKAAGMLFRAETEDHDSPDGEGGEHMIVNVWRPIQPGPVLSGQLRCS